MNFIIQHYSTVSEISEGISLLIFVSSLEVSISFLSEFYIENFFPLKFLANSLYSLNTQCRQLFSVHSPMEVSNVPLFFPALAYTSSWLKSNENIILLQSLLLNVILSCLLKMRKLSKLVVFSGGSVIL